MGTRHRMIWVGILVFCLCAGLVQVQAQVVKKSQGTLDDLKAASLRLQVHQVVLPVEQVRSEAAAMAAPGMADLTAGWDRFISDNGSQWHMDLDLRTGRPALASGSGLPWIPGAGNSLTNNDIRESLGANGDVTRGTLVRLAKKFIRQYPEFFGVDVADLQVAPGGTGEYGGYLWYVMFNRTYQGIPVENSYAIFRVNHGNLVQFGGEFMGPISVDTLPTISLETAQQIVAGYLGGMSSQDQWLDNGALTIVPMAPQGDSGTYNAEPGMGVDYHLVYTLNFRRDGVMGTWQAKVDAHTGEVLSFLDTNDYGSVKGGIYVTSNLDTEVVRPMPYAGVGTGTYANAAGVYSATSGTVTGSFTGKYVKVTDSCGTSSLAVTAPADINFGTSSGTDCTVPSTGGGAGNTHAARTGYYHLTLWKTKAMAWLPSNTWLTGQVGDKVNLSQTCNAYWDGSAVNFFKSGGGCSNTGELPTVFLHEIGHGLDSNDGSPSSTVGSSESYGDLNGILATHSSCLGINFIPGQQCSGYGNACTSCTGIRDADYTKHSSQSAATPAQLAGTSGFHCSKDSSYPGPCGYEGHCESYIMSEVGWDLAAKDLPAAGFDSNTSWYIADRLFFLTRPTAGDSYTCSGTTANGCGTSNWHNVYLVADDDNGNLSDGTPHAAAIYAAFNRHLISCSTSTRTNSTTCGSLGQVSLTATAGSGQVALSWPAVSGASKYQILRNELGATAGMSPITTTTGTSYTDTTVATGVAYFYTVGAVGASNACFGALSTVQSATPGAGTTYSISGTVSGAIASGVTMSLTGAATSSTTTDASGNYTFSGLANGSYTVTPSKSGYTFSPTSTAVTISSANQTGKNFTATAVAGTYSISGTVSGAATSGVTISLTGAASASTTTATGGTYSFSGLANGSYTVTPSLSGYTFSPVNIAVTIASANQTGKNFTATAVSGDTVLTSGVGVAGSVALQAYKYYTITVPSGATALSITLTGLSADVDLYANNSATHPTTSAYYGRSWNSGTTSESLSYTTPTVGTWSIAAYGYAAGNYTVTATVTAGGTTYSISGAVSGAATSGVTMSLTGAATATTTTGTGGTYTFSGLANGSYTVTPSLAGYTFSPTSTSVTISGANQTGKNFTATAVTTGYSISGTVSGAATSGVTMTLTGAASASTTTATGGTYSFGGLANGTYTVTPSLSGFTFSPTSTSVTISGANQTGKNFTASAVSGDTPLTSGVGAGTGSMALQAWKYFTIVVPSGATNLSITLTGLNADLDLYVNNSTTHPTTTSSYGSSTSSGTTSESLTYASPTVATWSIGVYAYAAGSGTVTATVTTGGGGTTIFSNGFESAWSQVDTSGTAGTWSNVTTGTYPTVSAPHGGTYMAKFNSYTSASGSATRYYQSTGFAVSSLYTTVTMTFWMYHDTGYTTNADSIQPQVSTNGSTWTSVGTAINRYDGSTGWKQHTVSLTTYKGSTVYLGFLGTSAYGNNIYLDDVTVVGQ